MRDIYYWLYILHRFFQENVSKKEDDFLGKVFIPLEVVQILK